MKVNEMKRGEIVFVESASEEDGGGSPTDARNLLDEDTLCSVGSDTLSFEANAMDDIEGRFRVKLADLIMDSMECGIVSPGALEKIQVNDDVDRAWADQEWDSDSLVDSVGSWEYNSDGSLVEPPAFDYGDDEDESLDDDLANSFSQASVATDRLPNNGAKSCLQVFQPAPSDARLRALQAVVEIIMEMAAVGLRCSLNENQGRGGTQPKVPNIDRERAATSQSSERSVRPSEVHQEANDSKRVKALEARQLERLKALEERLNKMKRKVRGIASNEQKRLPRKPDKDNIEQARFDMGRRGGACVTSDSDRLRARKAVSEINRAVSDMISDLKKFPDAKNWSGVAQQEAKFANRVPSITIHNTKSFLQQISNLQAAQAAEAAEAQSESFDEERDDNSIIDREGEDDEGSRSNDPSNAANCLSPQANLPKNTTLVSWQSRTKSPYHHRSNLSLDESIETTDVKHSSNHFTKTKVAVDEREE